MLHGLGGVGKTTIAVEYAYRHQAEVGVSWQLRAEEPAVLADEFARLADQLGARSWPDSRDPLTLVHAALASRTAPWLLIFDNVTDADSIARFLPLGGPGRVLITSQNPHWPLAQTMDVPLLPADVATSFLISRTGDQNRELAMALAAELDGLPLALEQAGAYIHATGCGLADYLSLFRRRRADLLTRGGPRATTRPSPPPGPWLSPGWMSRHRRPQDCCGSWPSAHPSPSRLTCCSGPDQTPSSSRRT